MKRISKAIVFVLTLCFTLSLLAPVATVHAAAKITLKSGAAAPSTVYTNKTYNLAVKGTAVKFYTSNKKVATVGATNGKLKPIAPGTVTITAKSKKNGKFVASMKFIVNQRATSVNTDVTDLYLSIGETYTINTSKLPATSTDVIRFYSADKTVATVGATSGKVTAVANGNTVIKIYCKATAATKNSNTYNKTALVNVHVGDTFEKVTQTSTTELSLTFKTLKSTPVAGDFKLTNLSTSQVIQIKSLTVDASDARKLTLTTFNDLKDGKDYELVYKNTKTKFTATNGTIARLSITPTSIPVNTPTTIYVEERDANGVLIAKVAYGTTDSYLDFTIDPGTNGYLSGSDLVLSDKTARATASAVYRPYQYDAYGNELGLVKTGNVMIIGNAIAEKPSVSYHIGDSTRADFDLLTKRNSTLAVNDEQYLSIRMTNRKNEEITNYEDYTVSSSNQDIMLVAGTLSSSTTLPITAIKAGTANILIKDSSDVVIHTLPVTVVAERKAYSLSLDKYSAVISGSSEVEDAAVFNVSLLDQYGVELSCDNIEVSLLKAVNAVTSELYAEQYQIDEEKDTVSFLGNLLGEGTYTFKIAVGEVSKTANVTVKMPSETAAASYKLILGDGTTTTPTIDAKVTSSKDIEKKVPIFVGVYRGNILASYQPITEIKVTLNGKAIDDVIVPLNDNSYQFVVSTGDDTIVKKAESGTYKLTVSFDRDGNEAKASASIVVKDTQTPLTVTPKAIQYTNSKKLSDYELVNDIFKTCFTFTVGNKTYKAADIDVEFTDDSYVLKDSYVVFKKVTAYVPLANNNKIMIGYNVPLSKSITIK